MKIDNKISDLIDVADVLNEIKARNTFILEAVAEMSGPDKGKMTDEMVFGLYLIGNDINEQIGEISEFISMKVKEKRESIDGINSRQVMAAM